MASTPANWFSAMWQRLSRALEKEWMNTPLLPHLLTVHADSFTLEPPLASTPVCNERIRGGGGGSGHNVRARAERRKSMWFYDHAVATQKNTKKKNTRTISNQEKKRFRVNFPG